MIRLAPKTLPRLSARRRGQALLELALIMPILAMLLLGVFDVGRAFADQESVTNAAMAGAKYKNRNPSASDSTVRNQVVAEVNGSVNIVNDSSHIVVDTGTPGMVIVQVTYDHDILFGLLAIGNNGHLTMTAQAAMPTMP
jgi:Flp pilus assembly protein TadG